MGYGNSFLYLGLRHGCLTNGSHGTQIQLFVDPFHRMFSLDNRSIQYPFAVVERVPVGEHSQNPTPVCPTLINCQYGRLSMLVSSHF